MRNFRLFFTHFLVAAAVFLHTVWTVSNYGSTALDMRYTKNIFQYFGRNIVILIKTKYREKKSVYIISSIRTLHNGKYSVIYNVHLMPVGLLAITLPVYILSM